ncbi:MAG: DUF892 family protein, partial [Prosthecobacter sp.]
ATSPLLQEAITLHLEEKKDHVLKLDGVFAALGERAARKTSEATIALLYESHEIISNYKGYPVINAALIAAVQKIEHYEIASHGCLRDWAMVLGQESVSATLQIILDQDKATNRTLTHLARTSSNQEALNGDGMDLDRLDTEAPTHEPFQVISENANTSRATLDQLTAAALM